jgi:uncharacterized membrane protein YcfT/CelD/BcsL family acetyltransferase involved in cellulose biosynthesis
MSHSIHLKREAPNRFAWVDIAKGLCIVAVVCLYARNDMMRIFQGAGWLEPWSAFARPFRMPDFFLLSGLFLSAVIARPWRSYLDTKVVHYAYFLALWVSILYVYDVFVLDSVPQAANDPVKFIKLWIWSFIYPDYMLWFIQTLPVFFVVTRLLRAVPRALLWTVAAVAMALPFKVGIAPVDNFIAYYVFFLTGHFCAEWIFRLADWARANRGAMLAVFGAWCVVNQWATSTGLAAQPGLDLAFGLLGISVVVGLCAVVAELRGFAWLAHAGANSIVVYLGFFIPLTLFLRLVWAGQWAIDLHVLALLAVAIGVATPLLLFHASRGTQLRYLFARPAWAHLGGAQRKNRVDPPQGPSRGSSEPAPASASAGTGANASALPIRVTMQALRDHPGLEPLWRDLASRSSCSFFLTWPWIGAWIEQLAPRCDARLLLAHSGQRVVGAAILVKTKRRLGPFPICDAWHLHATGGGADDSLCIEHNDLLIDREHGDDVRHAMLGAWSAAAGSGAELHLPGLAPQAHALARIGNLHRKDETKQSALVDLAAVRAAGLDFTNVLSSHSRRFVRRSMKEYRTLGELQLDVAGSAREALEFFDGLVRLHEATWRERGATSAFAQAQSLDFHEHLIERSFDEGRLQLLRVRAGHRAIGYLYSFIAGKRLFVFQSGFDYAAIEKHSRPGLVSHTLAIQYNASRGFDCYDLLAGESQYKATLATQTEPMTWSVLQTPALRLSAEQALRGAVWRWRRLMAS